MTRGSGSDFDRRTFLRSLGIGGGLYGLPQTTGVAGATRFSNIGSMNGVRPDDIETITISEVADDLYSEAWEDIKDRFWQWIHSNNWRKVIEELRNVVDLIASSASDAIDTALESVDSLDIIEDGIEKVDFIISNSAKIIDAIGDKIGDIEEELKEEGEEGNSSGSIGSVRSNSGTGKRIATHAGSGTGTTTTAVGDPVSDIGNKIDELKETAGELVSFVENLDDELETKFKNLWPDEVGEFVSDLKEGGLEGIIEPVVEGLSDLLTGPINRMTDIWSSQVSGDEIRFDDSIEHEVFDIDFQTGMKPVFVSENSEDMATSATVNSATAAGAGTAAGNFASSPGPGKFKYDLPLPVSLLQIPKEECRGAVKPVSAIGLDIVPDWPGVEMGNIVPYFGFDGVRPCVYVGASMSAGGTPNDFIELYQYLNDNQKSWEELAEDIRSNADEILTELNDASTLGDAEDVCREIQEFIDTLKSDANIGAIPLYKLIDTDDSFDFDSFYEEAESLERDIGNVIQQLAMPEVLIEVNEILTEMKVASPNTDGIPQFDTLLEATETILQAWNEGAVTELDENTLGNLVTGARAVHVTLTNREHNTVFEDFPESEFDLETLDHHLGLIQGTQRMDGVYHGLKMADTISTVNGTLTRMAEELGDTGDINGFDGTLETTKTIVEADSVEEMKRLEMDLLEKLVDDCRKLIGRVKTYEFNGTKQHDQFDGTDADLDVLAERLEWIATGEVNIGNEIRRTIHIRFKGYLEELRDIDPADVKHEVLELGGKYAAPVPKFECTDWICRQISKIKRAVYRLAKDAWEVGKAVGSWLLDVFTVKLPNILRWILEKIIQVHFAIQHNFMTFVTVIVFAATALAYLFREPSTDVAGIFTLGIGLFLLLGQEAMLHQIANVVDADIDGPVII